MLHGKRIRWGPVYETLAKGVSCDRLDTHLRQDIRGSDFLEEVARSVPVIYNPTIDGVDGCNSSQTNKPISNSNH